jgi:hypothetical protein
MGEVVLFLEDVSFTTRFRPSSADILLVGNSSSVACTSAARISRSRTRHPAAAISNGMDLLDATPDMSRKEQRPSNLGIRGEQASRHFQNQDAAKFYGRP